MAHTKIPPTANNLLTKIKSPDLVSPEFPSHCPGLRLRRGGSAGPGPRPKFKTHTDRWGAPLVRKPRCAAQGVPAVGPTKGHKAGFREKGSPLAGRAKASSSFFKGERARGSPAAGLLLLPGPRGIWQRHFTGISD